MPLGYVKVLLSYHDMKEARITLAVRMGKAATSNKHPLLTDTVHAFDFAPMDRGIHTAKGEALEQRHERAEDNHLGQSVTTAHAPTYANKKVENSKVTEDAIWSK